MKYSKKKKVGKSKKGKAIKNQKKEEKAEDEEEGGENEEEEEENGESEEEEEEESRTIEKILAHQEKEDGKKEYIVKWKDLSYLHISWVDEAEFAKDRFGKTKLLRYHKNGEVIYDENDELFNPSFVEVIFLPIFPFSHSQPSRSIFPLRYIISQLRHFPFFGSFHS